jgi:UPF0042 nucleotide-binding protein
VDFIIVTGMSGAGKTQAIKALEDLGYYCVDNVPPRLLMKFAELPVQSAEAISRIALVVDVRSRDMFAEYHSCVDELRAARYQFKTLFLDCDDETLARRFKETRHRHPLLDGTQTSLGQAIAEEWKLLASARDDADYIIDTSSLSAAQLTDRVRTLFSDGVSSSMVVSCTSFGYKHGLPMDADLVFDVRCLPNPFYIEELREKTGLDAEVRDFVLGSEECEGLLPHLFSLLDYLIPLYEKEGKSQLVIAVGCTGGKHRSVAISELLAERLTSRGSTVKLFHRDIALPNKR